MAATTPDRLLALDVDGTLLTHDYRIMPEVRDAVQAARRSGVVVALVTARSLNGLDVILEELGEVDYAICFGGALLAARHDRSWDIDTAFGSQNLIDRDTAIELAQLCRKAGLSFTAFDTTTAYAEEIDPRLEKEFSLTRDTHEVGEIAKTTGDFYKILVISDVEDVAKLGVLASAMDNRLSCATSHANYLEVCRLDVSKASGLVALARKLGMSAEQSVVIGDGENDLPMFGWAGLSIAMGNASEKVRGAADWVTHSNAEAGVARAIERLNEMSWNIRAAKHGLEENQ